MGRPVWQIKIITLFWPWRNFMARMVGWPLLGRLMRPHAEKTDAALFDFVDRKVPLLRRHHLERRKLYAEVLGVPASKLGTRKGAA